MLFQVFYPFFITFNSKLPVAGGRNIMPFHKFFGECLTAFQLSTVFGWSNEIDFFQLFSRFEVIIKAVYKWLLGTNNQYLDLFVYAEFGNRVEVIDVDININAVFGST